MKCNLHIYPSPFTHETRILKVTRTLSENVDVERIFIAAVWRPGLERIQILDDRRTVERFGTIMKHPPRGLLTKIMMFIEWSVRVIVRNRRRPIDMVNCHSLSTLPIGVFYKIRRKSVLIYDTHELETETKARGVQRTLSKIAERRLIRYADTVICVSDSIAEWYRNEYGRQDVHVVRNVPARANRSQAQGVDLREIHSVPNNAVLFIYQGILSHTRNVHTLLSIFADVAADKHIVFMGFGPLEEEVVRHASTRENIHFQPGVSPEHVIDFTLSADVGIHLIEADCLNHYYCLPNKVFEYLMGGIPIVVSDFPEMKALVDKYGCGWSVEVAPERVVALINTIEPRSIAEKKRGAQRAKHHNAWEKEQEILIDIYKGLVASAAS